MNKLIVAVGALVALSAIFLGHKMYIDGHSPVTTEEVKK